MKASARDGYVTKVGGRPSGTKGQLLHRPTPPNRTRDGRHAFFYVHAMHPVFFPLIALLTTFFQDPPTVVIAACPAVELGALGQQAASLAIVHAGLGGTDGEVDRMQARARASALLPELRIRGMETAANARDYVSGTTGDVSTTFYPPSALIEGSVVFHLDRLVYSGQEPRLERLRLERIEARAHLTQRVIEELSRWWRACSDETDSPAGTDAHADAAARRANAAMALDVWTGGWFSQAVR